MPGGADASAEGSIETGRWYDIKIALNGGAIKCYLDGKLIHDVQTQARKSLVASATLSQDGREVILKVVNTAAAERATEIRLKGVKSVGRRAQATVLTSAGAMDENTLDEPAKVAPVECTLDNAAASFTHAFSGNSVTVLRLAIGK